MTDPPRRRKTSWLDDVFGGLRSIGLEAMVVIVLSLLALLGAWIAVTVV